MKIRSGRNGSAYWHMSSVPTDHPIRKLDPLSGKDQQMVKRLAVKSVKRHLKPLLERNVKALEEFIKNYKPFDPYAFKYIDLAGGKYLPEGFLDIWKWDADTTAGNYHHNTFRPENLIFTTRRGERVRSKSEVFIADMLNSLGINYRYDGGLLLEGKWYYPDFQFIHPVTHQLITIEHLGMVDDPKYIERNLEKLSVYARNGLVLEENFFITWETHDDPLTPQKITELFQRIGII